MNKKKKILTNMILLLALIFSTTYYLSDKYITNVKNINSQEDYPTSSNINNSKLEDTLKVYLFSGNKKENELTVADIKKQLNIDGDITESQLESALKDKGYSLEMGTNNEMTFKRDQSKALTPNKYYVGEKDGFLAIYKTDENGVPLIENQKDVFSNNKKVDSLGESDKNKIRSFEFEYDSKEEAEENISEFLS